ncbi:MAG: LCP family protein [Hamadaea sp.]|uniref:LCP family protein n=1 Tax=Hamadaea sp. TaxID=2024425 RepID=UPI0017C7E639|nr:LCP family protein [Hamadaea sp.]NUR72229.1 LCP family protein [Hamadaea sp.]NUT17660.1 LCP family protein [Hamadaea sp.]
MPSKTSSRRASAGSSRSGDDSYGYDSYGQDSARGESGRAGKSGGHNLKPKKKKKVRSPLWSKLVMALGVVVTLLGFGGVAAAKSLMGDLTSSIETGSVAEDGTKVQAQDARTALKGPIDILMLGLDTRQGWADNTSRADTIIILHIPATHDQAYLISIPRDAEVAIPSWKKANYNGTAHDKINAAYYFGSQHNQGWQGGAGLMKKTVEQLTGLKFDGVVVIDFGGFKNVIQAMGGVYMCVERDTWSSHYIKNKKGEPEYYSYSGDHKLSNSWIHKKGCRNMAAWEALDYSRQRYGLDNSDYDRQKHQQQLLKSMAKKATSAGIITNPVKLSELIKAAGSSLKMDTNGVPLDDFIFTLKALAGSDLIALKTNAGTYAHSEYGTGEGITEGTKDMFKAAADDQLGDFITDNPEYLIPDKSGQ